MKLIKKFLLFFMVLLTAMFLFACGQKEEANEQQENQQEVVTEEEQSETEEVEETAARTIVDMAGREVELPEEINRVVSTHNPLTFFVFAVGGQDKLVATDTPSTKNDLLNALYPEIASFPGVGNKKGLNIEEIVKAEPDVVLLRYSEDTDPYREQLEQQGIPVVILHPETVDGMKETANLLGQIFGTEDQAKAIIDYYENTEKEIASRLEGVEKKTVYMTGSEFLKTVSADLYQNDLITKAGAINVAGELKGDFATVSTEQIVQWNPDAIVALQYCEVGAEEVAGENPQLASTNAYKNNALFRMPSNLINWDYPEPVSALGMLWLAKMVYPEHFEDVDIQKEADEFFQQFYGKTFTEVGGVVTTVWEATYEGEK